MNLNIRTGIVHIVTARSLHVEYSFGLSVYSHLCKVIVSYLALAGRSSFPGSKQRSRVRKERLRYVQMDTWFCDDADFFFFLDTVRNSCRVVLIAVRFPRVQTTTPASTSLRSHSSSETGH